MELKKISRNKNKNSNSPYKVWWVKNPMKYVYDEVASVCEESHIATWHATNRFVSYKDGFGKLNEVYLNHNPYFKGMFSDVSFKKKITDRVA